MITVEAVNSHRSAGGDFDCFVDAPVAGHSVDGHVLRLAGWALGTVAPVKRLEVGSVGLGVLAWASVARTRPDVEQAMPATAGARSFVFEVFVPLLGLPSAFSLWVSAIDEAGARHHIASLSGTRSTLELPPGSGPDPVMVTTLGRTGSTWLTQLLGAHPDMLALEPFRVDARVASYWAEVCRALVSSSYLAPLFSTEVDADLWWLGRSSTLASREPILDLDQWFSTTHTTDVAMFCRDRIQAFYHHAAHASGVDRSPRYVVEKFNPTGLPALVREFFPAGKELFLVRDFRDLLASVTNFNLRRGYAAFGRAVFASDEAYVKGKILPDAASLLKAWQSRRDRAFLVHYEDLVLQPRQTAANILEYLELPADETSATALVEGAQLPEDRTAAHRTTTDAPVSVGRWRRDLDVSLQHTCHEVLGGILVEFGYDAGLG